MTRESTRGPQYSNEVERRDRVLERRFKSGVYLLQRIYSSRGANSQIIAMFYSKTTEPAATPTP